jgi:hypothetical protein
MCIAQKLSYIHMLKYNKIVTGWLCFVSSPRGRCVADRKQGV